MCRYGLISTDDQKVWKKETEELFYPALKKKDRQILDTILHHFGTLTGRELTEHTYRKYPYYAINSLAAKRYLQAEDLERIEAERSTEDDACLMTIGYEGISAEAYFNQLIKHNVSALIDVRRNAMSMKYGFHKSQLSHVCRSVGMAYYHVPEVGICNDKRRSLDTQDDYDVLFEEYRGGTLQTEIDGQRSIIEIYKKHGRIALTCFEALPCQCHRSHLADNLHKLAPEEVPPPVHI